jgi:hypothetical protein
MPPSIPSKKPFALPIKQLPIPSTTSDSHFEDGGCRPEDTSPVGQVFRDLPLLSVAGIWSSGIDRSDGQQAAGKYILLKELPLWGLTLRHGCSPPLSLMEWVRVVSYMHTPVTAYGLRRNL